MNGSVICTPAFGGYSRSLQNMPICDYPSAKVLFRQRIAVCSQRKFAQGPVLQGTSSFSKTFGLLKLILAALSARHVFRASFGLAEINFLSVAMSNVRMLRHASLWSLDKGLSRKETIMTIWNPWHGCTKISAGCANCYMYRIDARHGIDSTVVTKTARYDLPVRRKKNGEYVWLTEGGSAGVCFSSDFFHPDADAWRSEAWAMMRERRDVTFSFITKRPERFYEKLPSDWGMGYSNVKIACTCENQKMADQRLPLFLELPIRGKSIICEPMLGPVDLSNYLGKYGEELSSVGCGGESGSEARVLHFDWVRALREQCSRFGVPFYFHQTGAKFFKDGRLYRVPRRVQHQQAKKAFLE